MRLDLTNLTCTFLDKCAVDNGSDLGTCSGLSIFIDVNDAYHFYVVLSGDNLCSLTHFQITDSKLDRKQSIRCGQHFLELSCSRLVNNRLQGFINGDKQYFGECDLAAPDRAIRKLFDLKTKLDFLTGSYGDITVSFIELF
jgi:hypothetical protein